MVRNDLSASFCGLDDAPVRSVCSLPSLRAQLHVLLVDPDVAARSACHSHPHLARSNGGRGIRAEPWVRHELFIGQALEEREEVSLVLRGHLQGMNARIPERV